MWNFWKKETVEGMEELPGHEDHREGEVGRWMSMWTSPKNAAAITRAIGAKMAELDADNAQVYTEGAETYAQQIEVLDQEFADFFAGCEDKTIVFGDRFPLRYFAEEFGLTYYAAFPGCSTQTEPSAATVAFLTDKVREEQIPTVWYIEFSNHLVADSIAGLPEPRLPCSIPATMCRPRIWRAGDLLFVDGRNLETLREYF